MKATNAIILAILLIAASIGLRLLPHAPNVAPIGALAIFAGVYFSKRWGWALPIAAMLASDFFLGFYDVRLMAVVYGSFLVSAGIGMLVKRRKNFENVVVGSLAGSVFFFIATNFAVWMFSEWYPKTAYGLIASYAAGLPFFRNTVVGDLFYAGVFFGGYALCIFLKQQLVPLAAKYPRLGFLVRI